MPYINAGMRRQQRSYFRRWSLFTSLATAAILCLAAVGVDKAHSDMDAIQGTWHFTKIIEDGQETAPDGKIDQDHAGMEFDKNQVYAISESKREADPGTFKLNPSKVPAEIEMTDPSDDNDKSKSKVIHGIYKLQGDILLICQSDGDDVPTQFKSDRHHIVYELKRVTAAATQP